MYIFLGKIIDTIVPIIVLISILQGLQGKNKKKQPQARNKNQEKSFEFNRGKTLKQNIEMLQKSMEAAQKGTLMEKTKEKAKEKAKEKKPIPLSASQPIHKVKDDKEGYQNDYPREKRVETIPEEEISKPAVVKKATLRKAMIYREVLGKPRAINKFNTHND